MYGRRHLGGVEPFRRGLKDGLTVLHDVPPPSQSNLAFEAHDNYIRSPKIVAWLARKKVSGLFGYMQQ